MLSPNCKAGQLMVGHGVCHGVALVVRMGGNLCKVCQRALCLHNRGLTPGVLLPPVVEMILEAIQQRVIFVDRLQGRSLRPEQWKVHARCHETFVYVL
jgi:hypothetical protein